MKKLDYNGVILPSEFSNPDYVVEENARILDGAVCKINDLIDLVNSQQEAIERLQDHVDHEARHVSEPADNQTPQPVDELEEILKSIFQAGYVGAVEYGEVQLVEYKNKTIDEAKARLLQWGTRQRIDELAGVRGWTEYDPDPKYSPRERFHIVPYIYLVNRIAELQASLKDGENQLGEKS